MPSQPLASRSRKAHLVLVTAAGALAAMLASCATDRLVSAAPAGVDLSGEWQLNENLSDDPSRVYDESKDLPLKSPAPGRSPGGFGRPGVGRPGGPGGSIDPGAGGPGGGENLTRAGGGGLRFRTGSLRAGRAAAEQLERQRSGEPGESAPRSRLANAGVPGVVDDLPVGLEGRREIKERRLLEEYTAGEQRTIPFQQTEADRSAGWRENYFVVITKAKKGPSKEDDFALDGEGHLIFATLVTHVKKGPIDFKRVYDRVRDAALECRVAERVALRRPPLPPRRPATAPSSALRLPYPGGPE